MSLQLWRADKSEAEQEQGSSVPSSELQGALYASDSVERQGVDESSGAASSRTGTSSEQVLSGGRGGEDRGGRDFCQHGGARVGPHRPRQDVFFKVR